MKKTMMIVLYQFFLGLMINTNDLRFVVDEELATINFNPLSVLKMVCLTRAPLSYLLCSEARLSRLRLSASEPHLKSLQPQTAIFRKACSKLSGRLY